MTMFDNVMHDECFCYGRWWILSGENFKTCIGIFDSGEQSALGSWFSWFSNSLKGFPVTFGLNSWVVLQDDGQRPFVVFDTEESHPLVELQEDGLSFD